MPYTPPSQRSPATTKPNSPILSRNHSYTNEPLVSSPQSVSRPSLPRSISSTSYLNKHRRTPSIAQNGEQSANGLHAKAQNSSNGSIRQSPPPANNLLIPSGAITTPPDSASDDEERGRHLGDLKQLRETLQSIELKRDHSPSGNNDTVDQLAVKPVRPALTPEARKISHSRSSSEIQLSTHAADLKLSPEESSSGSDIEDDELRIKPPLLRKKSGELVKPALRPSSRRRPSSMPGTPTFSKAVHFNDDIEQVRHFLQVDRPIAVSAGSSPVETYDSESEYPFGDGYTARKTEWEILLPNFPRETLERKAHPVCLEKIFLSSDNKTLIGTVAVANLSFHKSVIARFTFDHWKTTSEVVAEYNNDVRKKQSNDGCDRFNFSIKLADQANLESKTLYLCIRYTVSGQEFWDNNNNMNFQVDFVKKALPRTTTKQSGNLASIPRSRHSPSNRPRSFPSAGSDDDFGNTFDNKYQFGPGKTFLTEPRNTLRLKPKTRPNFAPASQSAQGGTQGGQAFSTRYDFGASLNAALTTAQHALGDMSGIKLKDSDKGTDKASKPAPGLSVPRPDAISSEKPDLKSAEYNELIQKFCFVRAPRPGTA
jgi:hypothetical protein